MKGLHDFIIELKEPLKDTFKTENGTELYAHKDFSVDRLSNRVAKVISVPEFYDTDIVEGDEVLFEPTILYRQTHQGVRQDFQSYVDKKDMLFRLTPNMVICYRKNADDAWKGHGTNLLVQPIKEHSLPITSSVLYIPETVKETKYKKDRVILLYPNKEIEEHGAEKGDEVLINPQGGVKFWLNGHEHWWLRTKDIWGKVG